MTEENLEEENPFAIEQEEEEQEETIQAPPVKPSKVHDGGLTFDKVPPKTPKRDEENLNEIRNGFSKTGTICIRPFIRNRKDSMGLEKHGMVIFPGTFQMEDMAAIEFRGKIKYVNGLDEFSDSIRKLPDGESKDSKIRMIRTIVSQLERERAYNHVDINDMDFWSKVTTFRPDNAEVWGKMSRKCGNTVIYLDPIGNIDDLLTIIAIENGGFPGISKSYEDARSSLRGQKWYLDKQSDTVDTKTTSSRVKNKALGLLEELSEDNPRKLFYISKLVENNSLLYNFGTLPNLIYSNMDNFITGKGAEKEVKKASNSFIDYASKEVGELKIRCAIKDAAFLKHIITKGDQMIYKADDNTLLGRNMSDVYEYLVNPINEEVLHDIVNKAMSHWKK